MQWLRMQLARQNYGESSYATNDGSGSGRGRGTTGARGGRGAPSAAAGYPSTRMVQETPALCHGYNSASGCSRVLNGRRCELASGRVLLHLCSQTNAKGEVCLDAHPKPEHK